MEKATTEKVQSEKTDQQKLYEEIKAALHDTYKGVEACKYIYYKNYVYF